MTDAATQASFELLLSVAPQLDACAPLKSFIALPEHTLLHAGPPFQPGAVVAPILNSAATAAVFEGWADNVEMARAAILQGRIHLQPAQDRGVVTPLAFVVSPSMAVLRVSDARGAAVRYSPLNDGPPPGASRFGAVHSEQAARLELLRRTAPAFAAGLSEPLPVLPIMQAGLASGDDLHGRIAAANAALVEQLAPRLSGEARDYLSLANQFMLNVIMAACALMIGAASGASGSRMVVAAGGNGAQLGWKIAGEPQRWHTIAARPPAGPHFPDAGEKRFLPAIGDSAVIDACGFGAAALRYAPEMAVALRGHVDERWFTPVASEAFIGAHPAFPTDLRLGLDLARTAPLRGIMLAALDADGEAGLIGRGIAPWPMSA